MPRADMLPIISIGVVISMTSLFHVSATPCIDVTSSVNCSFEIAEPCREEYLSMDVHGLKWLSHDGAILTTADGDDNSTSEVTLLSASPYNRYMYMPGTTDPRVWGMWTELISTPFEVHDGCLHYVYHNNACGKSPLSQQSKLRINLRSLDNTDDKPNRFLRKHDCVNDTKWYSDQISLFAMDGNFSVVFRAQQHGWTKQSVAVDHVLYTNQSCSLAGNINFEQGDCDWERNNMCGYMQSVSKQTGLRWEIAQQNHLTTKYRRLERLFESADRGGMLMVSGIDSSTTTVGLVSVTVRSPKVTIETEGCMVLSYYSGRFEADNNEVIGLVVSQFAKENNSHTSTVLHKFPSTLGSEWLNQHVTLPSGTYSLKFTARLLLPYGDIPSDFIAIDDVEVFQTPCDTVKCNPPRCASAMCSTHGRCVGRGIKHATCICNNNHVGKYCELEVPYVIGTGFTIPTKDQLQPEISRGGV